MIVQPIKKLSVVEQAIGRIYDLIKAQNLKENEKLPPERELSEMLGISRNSLREAIRVLDMLGIIRVDQGSGMVIDARKISDIVTRQISFVLLLNRERFRELFEARIVLETECASFAATRATDEEIAELKKTYKMLQEYQSDRKQGIQYELQLHMLIAKAAHNDVLSKILSSLHQVLHESRETTVPSSGVTLATVEIQGRIIEAIESRDQESAKNLMHSHITAVADRMKYSFD